MPPKRTRPIEYIESDDENDTTVPPPPTMIQAHTQIQSGSRRLSTTNFYYEMPTSPQKCPAPATGEPIIWRSEEATSAPTDSAMLSDEESDADQVKRMLEPGYVSTMQDERTKRKRGFLGVSVFVSLVWT
jgi:hypothetical protein